MTEITVLDMLRLLGLGAISTVAISLVAMVLATVVGILLGVLRFRNLPGLRQIIDWYVAAMRGVPILVLYFVVFFGIGVGTSLMSAIFTLVVYHSAYVSEIVRGGLEGLPRQQYDAAESVGLTFGQIMRLIALPQIWLSILPAMVGQFILLLKDVALASVIGVNDILRMGSELMMLTFRPTLIYGLIGVFYYALCSILQIAAKGFEVSRKRRLKGLSLFPWAYVFAKGGKG